MLVSGTPCTQIDVQTNVFIFPYHLLQPLGERRDVHQLLPDRVREALHLSVPLDPPLGERRGARMMVVMRMVEGEAVRGGADVDDAVRLR